MNSSAYVMVLRDSYERNLGHRVCGAATKPPGHCPTDVLSECPPVCGSPLFCAWKVQCGFIQIRGFLPATIVPWFTLVPYSFERHNLTSPDANLRDCNQPHTRLGPSVNSEHSHPVETRETLMRGIEFENLHQDTLGCPFDWGRESVLSMCLNPTTCIHHFDWRFASSTRLSLFPLSIGSNHQHSSDSMSSPDRSRSHRELPFRCPYHMVLKRGSGSNTT